MITDQELPKGGSFSYIHFSNEMIPLNLGILIRIPFFQQ